MAEAITQTDEERARLAALRSLQILDTGPERDFDDIVAFVAALCETPTALISLVDSDRQWFKAACGFGESETSLDRAICFHALSEETFLEIPDTFLDARTQSNPLCRGDDAVRFYAGAILRLDDGTPIGTLCVLDRRPRRLTDLQRDTMILLARQVVRQIELREALSAQRRLRGEIDHRVKNSLQMVASYLRLQRRGAGGEASDVLRQAEQQVGAIVALHGALNQAGSSGAIDISLYLRQIATLAGRTLPANVHIEADIAPALCDGERAAAVGVIFNEFVSNSVKHAFPDDRDGTIRVRGAFHGGRYELVLSDDGTGLSPTRTGGFGLSIIDAAARQLHAEIARPDAIRGTVLALTFPADSPSAAEVAQAG
jgi:two-component sensor histidine kinase